MSADILVTILTQPYIQGALIKNIYICAKVNTGNVSISDFDIGVCSKRQVLVGL